MYVLIYYHDLQLKVKPWRRPLTMGNQTSEMKENYKGEPEVIMATKFIKEFQPPKLSDHHNNGPNKVRSI